LYVYDVDVSNNYQITLEKYDGNIIYAQNTITSSAYTMTNLKDDLLASLSSQGVTCYKDTIPEHFRVYNGLAQFLTLNPNQIAIRYYKRIKCKNSIGQVIGDDSPPYDSGTAQVGNRTAEVFYKTITATVNKDVSNKYPDFLGGARHEFAIAYYDRGNRSGSANTGNGCIVDLPIVANNSVRTNIQYRINHRPPLFATHYQILYSKNTTVDWFLDMPVKTIAAGTNTNEYVIDINTNIRNYNSAIRKCIIPE